MADIMGLALGATEADVAQLLQAVTEQSFIYSAAGSFYGTYQSNLSQFDRFGLKHPLPNTEKAGLTFITRPRLNLTQTSLRQHSLMATLDSADPLSLPFSIRCNLDTEFVRQSVISGAASISPFVNNSVPFIIPLSNTLQSISGWPDFVVDTETTEGGFFSEDQTFVKGSDFLNRSYDLSLTFRDIQGGYVMTLLLYWLYWMALAARGVVTAYPDDISERRLCYTCSIYRFILDPSMKYITKWAKATGCFPKALPIGNSFNIGEAEVFLSSNITFTVPFQVNHVEYMNPLIFQDFNTVMTRFAGANYWKTKGLIATTNEPQYNYMGLPWIDVETGINELKWFAYPEELENPVDQTIDDISRRIQQRAEAQRRVTPPQPTPGDGVFV